MHDWQRGPSKLATDHAIVVRKQRLSKHIEKSRGSTRRAFPTYVKAVDRQAEKGANARFKGSNAHRSCLVNVTRVALAIKHSFRN